MAGRREAADAAEEPRQHRGRARQRRLQELPRGSCEDQAEKDRKGVVNVESPEKPLMGWEWMGLED